MSTDMDVTCPFTAADCINQWNRMFPAVTDANRTIAHLHQLEKHWSRLHFQTEKESSHDLRGPPKLLAFHIVWPWAHEIMEYLGPSIFCDATYKVTVYEYRVVMITTLDGNKQHRPLMCSFILRSTAAQWSAIFDIFQRR